MSRYSKRRLKKTKQILGKEMFTKGHTSAKSQPNDAALEPTPGGFFAGVGLLKMLLYDLVLLGLRENLFV